MKKLSLLFALLATAAVVQAQVEIRLTGATAFRAAAYRSYVLMFSAAPTVFADNADPLKANKVTLIGTISGLGSTVVRASYSGSVKGCQAIRFNENVNFLDNSGNPTINAVPHFAFMDNEPENVPFDVTGIESETIGVVPFVWIKNTAALADVRLDNVPQRTAKTGLSAVSLPFYQFTGNPADTRPVFFCGRAWTSGTRIITLAETEYGPLTPVLQAAYDPATKTYKQANAALTASTDPYNLGYGYEKGSDLKLNLTRSVADAPQFAVGMMSVGEAKGIETQWLKYNGQAYTKAAVINGLYSFWSYERLAWKTGVNSGNLATWYASFVTELDADLLADPDVQAIAIALSAMNVSRAADGGPIL